MYICKSSCSETCGIHPVISHVLEHLNSLDIKTKLEITCNPLNTLNQNSKRISVVSNIFSLQYDAEYLSSYVKNLSKSDLVIFSSDYIAQCILYSQTDTAIDNYKIIKTYLNPFNFERYYTKPCGILNALAYSPDWSKSSSRVESLKYLTSRFSNIKITYLTNKADVLNLINQSDFYIDLSWRQTDSSVINMALLSGLPVFYADSGCISEYVGEFGIGISDLNNKTWSKDSTVPILKEAEIDAAWSIFERLYPILKSQVMRYDGFSAYKSMLQKYENAVIELV